MNNKLKAFGGVAVVAAIFSSGIVGNFVGKWSVDSFFAGKKEGMIDEALIKSASAVNAKLPMMVDSETRLDSTVGLNKNFRYNYTLVNSESSKLDASDIKNALEQKVTNGVCTTPELRKFLTDGVSISYAYYGNDGKLITVITVMPSQCTGA